MTGWDIDRTLVFAEEFERFLGHVRVNSKDLGNIILGEHIFRAQRYMLNEIFEGLSRDIHSFFILKSRQLGVSTLSRALTLFWVGLNPGLKGYMIFDTDPHKEEARLEMLGMIEMLPLDLDFPRIKRQNRYLLELSNGSLMNFAAAGVREGKGSGVLGRSSGVNFAHLSELCSFSSEEGIESFKNSLSETFPDRLYIYESTARGYNLWHDMYAAAKEDPACKCIFIGWHQKDNQQLDAGSPEFARYGMDPPSERELKKIQEVHDECGWDITPEQLAWIRRKMDPTAQAEGDAPADYSGNVLRLQEQPWIESDAWQMTGATFFSPENLTEIADSTVSNKFKTYSYICGMEFMHSRIVPAYNARSTELKVWEDVVDDAVYIIAADVAFGADEKNDRSSAQVLRCYADGLDQVAEYAWPLITSKQYAWVLASLLGYYGKPAANQVYLMLEINGPGEAVWNELQSLKRELQYGMYKADAEDKGLLDMFKNVRSYLYQRSDSMTPGQSWQWKTTVQLKVAIMERLRDFVTNSMIRLRSLATVEEMRSITREGDHIAAQGSKKDDRVVALALGVRCWEDRVRRVMMQGRRTRASEEAKRRLTIRDQYQLFNENLLSSMFASKISARRKAASQANRLKWRGR